MRIACTACGAPSPAGFHTACQACGGMIDVTYDLARVRLAASDNAYLRFADLLPLAADAPPRLPDHAPTPLVHATRLGGKLGLQQLYLKNETVLPSRSTKDRMAAAALAYLRSLGVKSFCASSTGNSSTAFAHAIPAYAGMHLFLFTAELFVPRVQHAAHAQVTHFGLRDATFVEAGAYAATYAERRGLIAEGGFFNPGRREGLKLAFLEACDQCPHPIDWYVQAVSSAMGVYGVHKGAKELLGLGQIRQIPRLLCVQQESCAPMVRAHADGSDCIRPDDRVARPAGIAEAILRGDPSRAYPHVRRAVLESRGTFAAANEAEIRAARRDVAELEGIDICFSAATAVAGLARMVREGRMPGHHVVVVNLTGADRPPEKAPSVTWIERGRVA